MNTLKLIIDFIFNSASNANEIANFIKLHITEDNFDVIVKILRKDLKIPFGYIFDPEDYLATSIDDIEVDLFGLRFYIKNQYQLINHLIEKYESITTTEAEFDEIKKLVDDEILEYEADEYNILNNLISTAIIVAIESKIKMVFNEKLYQYIKQYILLKLKRIRK